MFDKINNQKKQYERQIALGFTSTIIAFVLFIPLTMAIGPAGFFIIAIPFMGGAVYAGKYTKKIKELSIKFKSEYVVEEMKKVFSDSTYNPNYGFTEHEVVTTGLLRQEDRFYSEDMISGVFEGVKFRCSDVKQEDVSTDSKGRTSTRTVFLGRFYEFDFPKSFKSNLLITQTVGYGLFGEFNRVKTESVDFNSELKVYAKDEHEAFFILTPDFMERLIYMDRKYKDKINFSFINNKLYISINNGKDTFDIKTFKEVDESIFREYQEEFKDIKNFIKVLKLDETLFI